MHISADESDNLFYERAYAGKAHFLITGNREDFPEDWKMTRIAGPREFLNRLPRVSRNRQSGMSGKRDIAGNQAEIG